MLMLVCTPDPQAAEAISRSLRAAGYSAIATVSVERAIEVVRRAASTLDAVILDVALGDDACSSTSVAISALAPCLEVVIAGEPTREAAEGFATAAIAFDALVPHMHALAAARSGQRI